MAMIAAKFGAVHLGGTRNAAKIGALAAEYWTGRFYSGLLTP